MSGLAALAALAAVPLAGAVRGDRLSERLFRLYRDLIERESGISLSAAKLVLVEGRLARRLRELRLGFGDYYELVVSREDERVRMLDLVCTNETHFFRERAQFEFLERRVYTEWEEAAAGRRRARSLRVWSAGCSTGEEPYSLAMSLLTRFPPSAGWSVDILATDLSTRALDRGRSGVWPLERAQEIPTAHLRAYMRKGVGSRDGWLKAGPEIRAVVRFQRSNLSAEAPADGPFDLVFCRNVMIYFGAALRTRVLERLLSRLGHAGHLFLGHAETLAGHATRTRGVGPSVYVHAGTGGR
jgi:chemotaxis protein methyltransferase CheR